MHVIYIYLYIYIYTYIYIYMYNWEVSLLYIHQRLWYSAGCNVHEEYLSSTGKIKSKDLNFGKRR